MLSGSIGRDTRRVLLWLVIVPVMLGTVSSCLIWGNGRYQGFPVAWNLGSKSDVSLMLLCLLNTLAYGAAVIVIGLVLHLISWARHAKRTQG